jgi:hypothetical protein
MHPSFATRVAALTTATLAAVLLLASPAAAHPGHGGSDGHTHAQGNEVLAGLLPMLFVVGVVVVAATLFLRGRAKDRS